MNNALRLSWVNTQIICFDKRYFCGVPAPKFAVTVSAFFLFYFNKNFNPQLSIIFAYIIAVLLPALMVSRFRYDTMPKFSGSSIRQHPVKFIIVILAVILIAVT